MEVVLDALFLIVTLIFLAASMGLVNLCERV